MNATRAATIRLRSSFDGAVSLGRVQTPTLAILARREEEIRAFTPEPYWLVDAAFAVIDDAARAYEGRYYAGANPRLKTAEEAKAIVAACEGQTGGHHQARDHRAQGTRAAALRPHLAAARRQQPLRVLGPPDAGRRPAALRGAQGAHLSADQLPLPDRRHGRRDQADRQAGRPALGVRGGVEVRHRTGRAPARPRGRRRQGHRSPRDHPHQRRVASGGQVQRRRPSHLRPGRPSLPGRLPPRGGVREHPRSRRPSPSTCSAPGAG